MPYKPPVPLGFSPRVANGPLNYFVRRPELHVSGKDFRNRSSLLAVEDEVPQHVEEVAWREGFHYVVKVVEVLSLPLVDRDVLKPGDVGEVNDPVSSRYAELNVLEEFGHLFFIALDLPVSLLPVPLKALALYKYQWNAVDVENQVGDFGSEGIPHLVGN